MAKSEIKGNLQFINLETLISENCDEQRNCCIIVQNGQSKGEIYLESGNVVHATIDYDIGEQAFRKILNLNNGIFELISDKLPANYTINKNFKKLLLESTQIIDENRFEFDWDHTSLDAERPVQNAEKSLENFINALKSIHGVLEVTVYSKQTATFINNTNLDLKKVTNFIEQTKQIGKLFQAVRLNYSILHNSESLILINYGLNSLILTVDNSEINEVFINRIKLLLKQYK